MYTIIRCHDGKFHCEGRLQDGTERWNEPTLEAAIESMKLFARAMNGTKIKKKDIDFLQPLPVTEIKLVPWKP